MIFLDSSYESWKNEALFVKIGTRVYGRTYGLICFLGPSGSNAVCMPQTTRSSIFLRFYNFTGFILWFFRKGGSVCKNWNQGPRLMARNVFWVQVGCLCVNVVSTPQSPRSRIFVRLQNFIEFISWFLRKRVPAFENWSQDSGLTAAYVFWVQEAQT